MLYADDLTLIAESLEALKDKVISWKEATEAKGLKMNVKKTKTMISGKGCGEIERTGRWPCAVCGKGVMANSMQCTKCHDWVHKKCSGIRGSLMKERHTFECKTCLRSSSEAQHRDMVIEPELELEPGQKLESVKKFCYLGDVLNGEGGANSASIARIRCAWESFMN